MVTSVPSQPINAVLTGEARDLLTMGGWSPGGGEQRPVLACAGKGITQLGPNAGNLGNKGEIVDGS